MLGGESMPNFRCLQVPAKENAGFLLEHPSHVAELVSPPVLENKSKTHEPERCPQLWSK